MMFRVRSHFPRMLAGFVAAAVVLVEGCVSEEVGGRPVEEITFTVVRSADRVKMNWPSKPGERYTVLFSKDRRPNTPWKPLPSAMNLLGTGETLTVEDRVPEGQSRYYRLHRGAYPPVPSR